MDRHPSALAAIGIVVLVVAGCGDKTQSTDTTVSIVRDSVGPSPGHAQLTTPSGPGDISASGRFVVYVSADPALPGATGATPFVYQYDRQTGVVLQVSTRQAVGKPKVSSDGSYVAFTAAATGADPHTHVFRSGLFAGGVEQQIDVQFNVDSSLEGDSTLADMSSDGSFVLFFSTTKNLDPFVNGGTGISAVADSTLNLDLFRWAQSGGGRPIVRVNSQPGSSQLESATPVDATAAAISDNGQFVVFSSAATDLITPAPSGLRQVYRQDVVALMFGTPSLTVISANAGTNGDGDSYEPDISGDGLRVAFTTMATNLVTGATMSGRNVALADIGVSSTTLVPVSFNLTSTPATLTASLAGQPRLSQNGHVVAFTSAVGLTPGAGSTSDVYIRDVDTADTSRVTVGADGGGANGASSDPAVGSDGLDVEFTSGASNLISGDTNGVSDIFVALMPPTAGG